MTPELATLLARREALRNELVELMARIHEIRATVGTFFSTAIPSTRMKDERTTPGTAATLSFCPRSLSCNALRPTFDGSRLLSIRCDGANVRCAARALQLLACRTPKLLSRPVLVRECSRI
jgi:hypothetical protein